MVEKAVDVKAKASLQPPSGTRKIDFRCPKGYKPSVKKDKDDANRKHRDEAPNKDKDKAKSYNSSSTNQPQTQASKKHKRHGSRQRGHLATGDNATEVAKKDKDKAKDLNHIQYYTCKQKGHYANKCPEKSKN